MRTLELLAPAKNLECGIAAIDHGADAVYIGAPKFGARAAAGNSLEDIKQLCDYAHQFGAKVHVTVNTIIYDFTELSKQKFDGMIVTGAPIETMKYEDVEYWPEITQIFDWARTHVTSTLYICWGAQAGLYHFYGVPKYPLEKKMFGIFQQKPLDPSQPIFRGFDDVFNMPHSRHTEVRREDIEKVPGLDILAESPESGVSIVMARGGREFFVTGHLEYAPNTLDKEYKRDMGKRDDVDLPKNYYYHDDPNEEPLVTWRAHANLFYSNWINYYVYQETPYNIDDIK